MNRYRVPSGNYEFTNCDKIRELYYHQYYFLFLLMIVTFLDNYKIVIYADDTTVLGSDDVKNGLTTISNVLNISGISTETYSV